MSNLDQIKQLRADTEISIGECKKALEEANGDIARAKEILKKWGKDLAAKKSERTTSAGIIASYIHANAKVGAIIELRCETDFVAKSDDFKYLAHELCLQFAAMGDDTRTLLDQAWIKDPQKTVKNLIEEVIAKIGENITIGRVIRCEI